MIAEGVKQNMLLRVARAAVRDHAPRDVLAEKQATLDRGDRELVRELVKDHAWQIQEREWFTHHLPEQRRRSVAQTLATAKILGRGSDHDRKYGHDDGLVIDVTYAETWGAVYEARPNGDVSLWMD